MNTRSSAKKSKLLSSHKNYASTLTPRTIRVWTPISDTYQSTAIATVRANRRNVIMEAIEKQNPQSTPNSSQNNNVRSKKRKRNQSSKGDRRVSLVKV